MKRVLRKELDGLSMKVFGVSSKWRKLLKNRVYSSEEEVLNKLKEASTLMDAEIQKAQLKQDAINMTKILNGSNI